jgi:hypothetical protein
MGRTKRKAPQVRGRALCYFSSLSFFSSLSNALPCFFFISLPLLLPRSSASSTPDFLVVSILVEFVEDELVEGEVVVGEVVVGEVVVVEGEVVVCEPDPDPPPEPPPVPAAKARAAVPSTKVPASVIVRRCFIVIHKPP